MELGTVVADSNAYHLIGMHRHKGIEVAVLRIGARYKLCHHVAKVVEGVALTTEMQTALVGHSHHDEMGYLGGLSRGCGLDDYHRTRSF